MVGSQWLAHDQFFTANHQKRTANHATPIDFTGFMVVTHTTHNLDGYPYFHLNLFKER